MTSASKSTLFLHCVFNCPILINNKIGAYLSLRYKNFTYEKTIACHPNVAKDR